MRQTLFLIVLIIAQTLILSAQSEFISNPSFEGGIGQGRTPNGWYSCNNMSTLDTRPYRGDILPTAGSSYLGLVMRGLMDPKPKNEDAVTKLIQPLYRDSTYYLSIDAALVPYEYDVFGIDSLFYDNPSKFRVSGGKDSCSIDELLYVSELISDSFWNRHYFQITPTIDSCKYLKIEIYQDTMRASYIFLDNLTLSTLKISGDNNLCQGNKNKIYSIPHINCATNFNWSYSGAGATLVENNDSVLIDFDSTATSGILSLIFNDCNRGIDTVSLPINVNSLSTFNMEIIGENQICVGQGSMPYYLIHGKYETYTWNYSGTGVHINGNSDSVRIYFSSSAEDGVLQVFGDDNCSSYLPITTLNVPSRRGEIIGEEIVCTNQKNVIYTSTTKDSSLYIWDYSGQGATIKGSSDSVVIDFSNNATDGHLSVKGQNRCGIGYRSSTYITINKPVEDAGEISGMNIICPGQNITSYYIDGIMGAREYIWRYDGNGVKITEDRNLITIYFSDSATSGNLTVAGRNQCGIGNPSPYLPITLAPLPSENGKIIGDSNLCVNQKNVIFQLDGIENLVSYVWDYQGTGATISRSSSTGVSVDFNKMATSGNLKLEGRDGCGSNFSLFFPINLNSAPVSPEIVGDKEVCFNNSSVYQVKPDNNSNEYIWNYTGSGDVLYTNNDEININFSELQNPGFLSVAGKNECGLGSPSIPVYLNASLCDMHIPNSFSPNNDGVNDLFVIRGLPEYANLVVFDRLGSLVYESNNYQNDWNGENISGEKVNSDTYWYILTIEGISNEYKGFIYLKN